MDYEEFMTKERDFSGKDRLELYMDANAAKGWVICSQGILGTQKIIFNNNN